MSMDLQSRSKINYMFVPSLKDAALVKVASTLWNQSDVRDLFSENVYDDRSGKDDWQVVENKVIEKVPKLHLPRELKKLLIYYIHPVGLQILDWIKFHIVQCRFVTWFELPSEFFWTPQGYMDNGKVAETLVNDKRLDICIRFKLACTYCLEPFIKLLWPEVQNVFSKDEILDTLPNYWSYYVAGIIDQMYDDLQLVPLRDQGFTFTLLACKLSVNSGNEAGTRYFIPRLTPEDREHILLVNIKYVCLHKHRDKACFSEYSYSNNLCFLLSQMDEGEQDFVFCCFSAYVVCFLLNWPWQRFFWRTVKENWHFFDNKDFNIVLEAIGGKIFSKAKDFNYQKLFGKFWQLGCDDMKRHAINNGALKSMLPGLFAVGDSENIRLIFKAATDQEKEELFFSLEGQFICCDLIEYSNWNLFKLYIQECVSSEVFLELELKLEEIFILLSCDVKTKENWDMLTKFYYLLYDVRQEKIRKLTEDKIKKFTKKLCSSR